MQRHRLTRRSEEAAAAPVAARALQRVDQMVQVDPRCAHDAPELTGAVAAGAGAAAAGVAAAGAGVAGAGVAAAGAGVASAGAEVAAAGAEVAGAGAGAGAAELEPALDAVLAAVTERDTLFLASGVAGAECGASV